MTYFLIVWFTLINGQTYANVSKWDTEAECQTRKVELAADMARGKNHGRWGLVVEEFHAVCVPEKDATIET